MNGILEFHTQGYNGYAVKYSPFLDSRIAVAASANYGLVGNGRLFILALTENGIQPVKWFDTNDALYDTAWSEANETQITAACGDGAIKIFDLSLSNYPVQSYHEHKREAFAVHWNLITKDTIVSSSWDGTIKVWSPERPASIITLPTHSCTYSTAFSPHSPSLISSVSSDSQLRIFDLRSPASASNHLVSQIPVHSAAVGNGIQATGNNLPRGFPPAEILTHDWNKYREGIIATAGVDRLVRTFDIRNPKGGPIAILDGHEYAVRKLAWSPHLSDVLLTASYDMTCRIWSDGSTMGTSGGPLSTQFGGGRQLGVMDRHTEFATGLDWCLFGSEGWCASVAWDQRLLVWDVRNFICGV